VRKEILTFNKMLSEFGLTVLPITGDRPIATSIPRQLIDLEKLGVWGQCPYGRGGIPAPQLKSKSCDQPRYSDRITVVGIESKAIAQWLTV
jgi:hypothetical protein